MGEILERTGRFTTLSDLVRSSVENEISDEGSDQEETSPALVNDNDELGDELAELREDVAWLREQRKPEVDVSSLADGVLQELEKLPSESVSVPAGVDLSRSEYKRQEEARKVVGPHDSEGSRNPQTARAIQTARRRLKRLAEDGELNQKDVGKRCFGGSPHNCRYDVTGIFSTS